MFDIFFASVRTSFVTDVFANIPLTHTPNVPIIKASYSLNPEFIQNIFCINSTTYSLRAGTILTIPQCKSTYGLNTFNFRATLAWNHLPKGLKDITSLKSLNPIHSGVGGWGGFRHALTISTVNFLKTVM